MGHLLAMCKKKTPSALFTCNLINCIGVFKQRPFLGGNLKNKKDLGCTSVQVWRNKTKTELYVAIPLPSYGYTSVSIRDKNECSPPVTQEMVCFTGPSYRYRGITAH